MEHLHKRGVHIEEGYAILELTGRSVASLAKIERNDRALAGSSEMRLCTGAASPLKRSLQYSSLLSVNVASFARIERNDHCYADQTHRFLQTQWRLMTLRLIRSGAYRMMLGIILREWGKHQCCIVWLNREKPSLSCTRPSSAEQTVPGM